MKKEHPLIKLSSYISEFKLKVIIATIFSILNKLFDLAPPILIGVAIDIVLRRENSYLSVFGFTNVFYQLYFLAFLTFVIWGFESIFEYAYKIYWRSLAQSVEHKLRIGVYSHIQKLDLDFFEEEQSGNLMSILNDDVNQLERFLDIGANDIIQIVTTVIAISFLFFALSPIIGAIIIVPIIFVVYSSIKFQKKLEPKYASVREQVGILNGKLLNNLSGITTIKAYVAERLEVKKVEEHSNNYQKSNRSAILVSSAFSPLIRMVIVTGFIGMLLVGGFLTLSGNLEVAEYSVIIFLIQRLLWPLTRLGETFDQYQRAMASVNRALGILKKEPNIKDGTVSVPCEVIRGKVTFETVGFKYHKRKKILNSFTVKIEAGQMVAFVGMTGAGKSTLVKLLLRFYDAQEGTIYLDDIDIKNLKLSSLRNSIGLVSQDTFIFDGSIGENIIYGKQNATKKEVKEAAKIAEIHDFILSLPNQYETKVGERGQKLSGGQRQRISIARAVLKKSPILILDEATSNVDNETEALIQLSLEKIGKNRTTILIAHRLSTVKNADKIFVLENGEISESGTHMELLKEQGIYSSLWKVQTGW